jgi:hypothetical protein
MIAATQPTVASSVSRVVTSFENYAESPDYIIRAFSDYCAELGGAMRRTHRVELDDTTCWVNGDIAFVVDADTYTAGRFMGRSYISISRPPDDDPTVLTDRAVPIDVAAEPSSSVAPPSPSRAASRPLVGAIEPSETRAEGQLRPSIQTPESAMASTVALRAASQGQVDDILEGVAIRGLTNEMNEYLRLNAGRLNAMFQGNTQAAVAFAGLATLFNQGTVVLHGEDEYVSRMMGDTLTDRIMGWEPQ